MSLAGFVLTLRGDRGVLMYGFAEAATFGPWALTPRDGKQLADLRVSLEIPDPVYGAKAPTGIRIHFPHATGKTAGGTVRGHHHRESVVPPAPDEETWWLWRKVKRVAPGHYTVEGLPEVS